MQDTKMADGPALAPASAARLALTVNGVGHATQAATLGELLAELGYGGNRVATAVNGDFVPERLRSSHVLASSDAIEIVAPRQGG
jgi:sulfur carrier protein